MIFFFTNIFDSLGAKHDFEDDLCRKNVMISKAHDVMAIGGRVPLIWSICSQMSIARLLRYEIIHFLLHLIFDKLLKSVLKSICKYFIFYNSKKKYLLNKPKVFIDMSHEPSLGKFYSVDKQCEMIDGPGFIFDDRTLNSSINRNIINNYIHILFFN